jgi:hypothetical protein
VASSKAACVFVSVCCPHFEDKRDLLLGLAEELAARGAHTILVIAGRRPCAHIIRLGCDDSACGFWFERLKSRAASLQQLEIEVVGERQDFEAQVEDNWARIAHNQPRVWSGQRLEVIARASIVRHRSSPLINITDQELAASYEKDTLRHLLYYQNILARQRPEVAVYFGGQFHQDRTAFIACRASGVSTFAIETAFVPGYIYFDEAGVTGCRGAIGSQALLHETDSRVLSAEEIAAVDNLMARSFHMRALRPLEAERERVRHDLQVTQDERVLLFLGQVGYDASLTTDAGAFTSQAVTVSAIQSVVSTLPRTKLMVRPHPKSYGQRDGASQAAIELGVSVLDQSSSVHSLFELLCAADVVITVSSQAGLQAAWHGVPVVTLGRPFYGGKGFTVDAGGHMELLRSSIVAALTTPRGTGREAAVSYISVLSRHMLDRPDAADIARRILSDSPRSA